MVSEFLEGVTLRERMAGGALAQRKAIDCTLQTTRGLAAADEKRTFIAIKEDPKCKSRLFPPRVASGRFRPMAVTTRAGGAVAKSCSTFPAGS